jgi:adenylate cyclase, class 2
MEHTGKEVEIKLRIADLAAMRRALARAKAKPVGVGKGRVHEMNTLFDTPDGGLAKHGQMLRIRVAAPEGKGAKGQLARTMFTYKGPSVKDTEASASLGRRYKVRDEAEVEVAGEAGLRLILEAIGLRGWFRYEKFRTTYQLPPKERWAAELHVQLDETPIGAYLELEGPPEAIDRAAELLGYHHNDYITKSYLAIWLEQAKRQGKPAGDLLFPRAGQAT